jgi:hypothetical protein
LVFNVFNIFYTFNFVRHVDKYKKKLMTTLGTLKNSK